VETSIAVSAESAGALNLPIRPADLVVSRPSA
jgi:hypothetical protein